MSKFIEDLVLAILIVGFIVLIIVVVAMDVHNTYESEDFCKERGLSLKYKEYLSCNKILITCNNISNYKLISEEEFIVLRWEL